MLANEKTMNVICMQTKQALLDADRREYYFCQAGRKCRQSRMKNGNVLSVYNEWKT